MLLSITTNQIVTCSNGAGSVFYFSWSRFQTAGAKVLFDVVRLCFRAFKLKNLFAKKSIRLEKLANARNVSEIQPTGTMVVDS